MSNLLYNLRSGKNIKALFFARGELRKLVPAAYFRARARHILKNVESRSDYSYIMSRVDYYNRLANNTPLLSDVIRVGDITKEKHASSYYYDTIEIARYFDSHSLIRYEWGDVTHVPSSPAFVKSRPIDGENTNSVLLKLDKIRHFIYVNDTVAWEAKKPVVYFRGKIPGKAKRELFFRLYFGNKLCNLGDSSRNGIAEWKEPKSTIREHLNYRYILALEGNDVASNLKWVMSSNSLAVMPRPQYETWFMEGTLVPDVHYLEIKADYSDLEERIAYCEAHPDFAKNIVRNANAYVAQFRNEQRELIISLLTFKKYLECTKNASVAR